MRRHVRLAVVLSLVLGVTTLTLSLDADSARSEAAVVDEMIVDLRNETSKQARWERAYELSVQIREIVDGGRGESLGISTIDSLAALLEDESYDGDFYVAGALGFIGARADRAVPSLEAAHAAACAEAHSHIILIGLQYVHAIELALQRITGSGPDCLGMKLLQQ